MPVDPDDLLIFKMRETKRPQPQRQKPAAQAARAKARPQPSADELREAVSKKKEAERAKAEEERQKAGEISERVKEKEAEDAARKEAEKYVAESRLLEVEKLEKELSGMGGTVAAEKPKNAFQPIAVALFFIDAAVLAYFLVPQAGLLLDVLTKSGAGAISVAWSYGSTISLVNMLFVAATAFAGITLFARVRLSHLISGVTAGMLILASTFEYLNSNATYLLAISVLSFVGIAAVAYSNMSSVGELEKEEQLPEKVNWPRIETF